MSGRIDTAISTAYNHSTVDLQELVDRVAAEGRIKPPRLYNVRHALKRYAGALGYESLRDCPESAFNLDRASRNELIEEHLGEDTPRFLRNVKNNVSLALRHGQELGLIRPPAPAPEAKPKQFGRRKVRRALPALVPAEDVAFHRTPYSLPLEQWPAHLRRQYNEWRKWVSEARTPARGYNPQNRAATVQNKTYKFEAFFGYLRNVRGIEQLDFRMLLDYGPARAPGDPLGDFSSLRNERDIGLLAEFVWWHREHRLGRLSVQAREVVSTAASVARRFYALRAAEEGRQEEADSFSLVAKQIGQLWKVLKVRPIIEKERRRVSLDDLLRAARAEFPQRALLPSQSGAELATKAGRAVALMLLIHHPLRNRHYREARLSRNLVKKSDGKWYLHFPGEEVSVARKVGSGRREPEDYEAPLDPETADYLERYLREWRPRLVGVLRGKVERLRAGQTKAGGSRAGSAPISEIEGCEDYLFLSARGGRFTAAGFSQWIQAGTYRWLGVRVNPQLISEIAAEDVLRKIRTPPSDRTSINTTSDGRRTSPSGNNSRRN